MRESVLAHFTQSQFPVNIQFSYQENITYFAIMSNRYYSLAFCFFKESNYSFLLFRGINLAAWKVQKKVVEISQFFSTNCWRNLWDLFSKSDKEISWFFSWPIYKVCNFFQQQIDKIQDFVIHVIIFRVRSTKFIYFSSVISTKFAIFLCWVREIRNCFLQLLELFRNCFFYLQSVYEICNYIFMKDWRNFHFFHEQLPNFAMFLPLFDKIVIFSNTNRQNSWLLLTIN